MRRFSFRRRSGFTLVELLVVIAIIGILVALLLPAVQAAREAARRTQCVNNLKQLGLATLNFHDVSKTLPAARWHDKYQTWFACIMPYLEASNEYALWHFDKMYSDPVNKPARVVYVAAFFCPSRRGGGGEGLLAPASVASIYSSQGSTGDYAGNNGKNVEGALAAPDPKTGSSIPDDFGTIITPACFEFSACPNFKSTVALKNITDGTSKTFLAGEKHVPASQYALETSPDDSIYQGDFIQNHCRGAGTLCPPAQDPEYLGNNPYWGSLFGSKHPGITQFVFCDGSVRPVQLNVDLVVYEAAATRNQSDAGTGGDL
jgi:prepilin-type N-terminal cleavage/methylation domain-containing protein